MGRSLRPPVLVNIRVVSKEYLRLFGGGLSALVNCPQRKDSEPESRPGQPYWPGPEIPTEGNGIPGGRVGRSMPGPVILAVSLDFLTPGVLAVLCPCPCDFPAVMNCTIEL